MGTVLKLFRRYTGSSQTQVGMALGIPQPHVSDIERGHRRVLTLEMIERFAAGLGIPRALVGLAPELRAASASADGGRQQRQGQGQVPASRNDQPPAIAPAGGGSSYAPAEPLSPALSGDAAFEILEMMRRAERSDVGKGTIESLFGYVDRLCRDYPSVPADVLLAQSKMRLEYTLRLLDGRVTLGQHRDLLVVGGWLSLLMGCLHYDLGHMCAASAARDAAYQFGKEAGHSEVQVWSYELQAWFALTERRFDDVIAAAEAGIARGEAGKSGTVQLSVQKAKAYARRGQLSEAERALEEGNNALAKMPRPDHPEHHFVFDPTKFTFYAATCYQWLGQDDKAQEMTEQVFADCQPETGPPRWPMRMAEAHIGLGVLAAKRDDLERAVNHGITALRTERLSGPSHLDRARDLDAALQARFPTEPAAQEFHDLVEQLRTKYEGTGA